MTGTIRNQDSRPCFARVNPEKETKRRRRGVSTDCEEWVVRISAGRRGIDYLHGRHHGHVPQVRRRQRRGAESGSKRRNRRRDRRETRARKMATEDTRPLHEQLHEDEECFEGRADRFRNLVWEFLDELDALESTGAGCLWWMDSHERQYVDLQFQWLERMKRFYNL